MSPAERLRALGWFAIAAFYAVFAKMAASWLTQAVFPANLAPETADLLRIIILLFLLIAGFAGMGAAGQQQRAPLEAMGLVRRAGAGREFALGAVIGWGGLLACVLPAAVIGGLVLHLDASPGAWWTLFEDFLFLALAALAEEVAFRGYPFQRLIEVMGPSAATLGLAALFATAHVFNPDSSAATWLTTFLAGWLLSLAYLRTRALWVGWGFHFAWNAATCLLFGLPLSGLTGYSPVISSYSLGPVWVTGGGYGPEGSGVAVVVLVMLLVVMVRATRELRDRHAMPVLIPGGIPVDVDRMARAQHEQAMGGAAGQAAVEAPSQGLVQISPATPFHRALPPGTGESGEPG